MVSAGLWLTLFFSANNSGRGFSHWVSASVTQMRELCFLLLEFTYSYAQPVGPQVLANEMKLKSISDTEKLSV
jgi:prophage antirepressor-like protein